MGSKSVDKNGISPQVHIKKGSQKGDSGTDSSDVDLSYLSLSATVAVKISTKVIKSVYRT